MSGGVSRSAVLYHYPCPDGVFAALAAHLYFSAKSLPVAFFPNTVYDPIRAKNFISEEFDEIYLLDFVGPEGFVSELSTKAKSITILDHHKTAQEMFARSTFSENVKQVIDMKRSGATIAYDFFSDKLSGSCGCMKHEINQTSQPWGNLIKQSEVEKVKLLFKLIEDGDLWKWELPGSKAFSSGLKDMNLEFDFNLNPNIFRQLLDLDPEVVTKRGQGTLLHKQKLIDQVLEKSFEIALGNGLFGNCLAVNADAIANLRSELGHQLATKSRNLGLRGIGAVVYKVPELENDNMLKVSLRSVESEDTTLISKTYGGGGHRNASSFLQTSEDMERWKVRDRSNNL